MGESPLIPSEVIEQLRRFHESIISTEDALEPFLSQKPEDRLKLTTLEQARCNLLSVFAINSFYWILLRLKGLNPSKSESLANELKRTQDYMSRLKTIDEKDLAPRINQRAAASFVRNALWEPKDKNKPVNEAEEDQGRDVEDDSGDVHGSEDDLGSETAAATAVLKGSHCDKTSTNTASITTTAKRLLPVTNQSESVVTKKMKSEKPESG